MWSLFNGRIGTLTYKQVTSFLKSQGFEPRAKGATAHEHWERIDPVKGKLKVTVDKHVAPFKKTLIKSMASQAGYSSVKEFYGLCAGYITEEDLMIENCPSENQ